jgi:hypothetical protein
MHGFPLRLEDDVAGLSLVLKIDRCFWPCSSSPLESRPETREEKGCASYFLEEEASSSGDERIFGREGG